MSSYPYVPTSNIFNTADYKILNGALTKITADKLYLSLNGGTISNLNIDGSLTINSTPVNLSSIAGVSNGTALPSKALILDSNGDIDNIRRLHCSGNISIGLEDYGFTPRMLGMIDPLLANASSRFLTLGKAYSTRNSMEWAYNHISDGNTNNRMDFSFFGVNGVLSIRADRRVGVNTTAPAYTLDTNGISHGRSIYMTPTNQIIDGFLVSGVLTSCTTGRFQTSRIISSDAISLLSYSAGGTFSDYITFDHNAGAPQMNIQCKTFTVDSADVGGIQCFSCVGTVRANFNQHGLRISGSGGGSGSNRGGVGLDVTAVNNVLITSSGSTFDRLANTWNVFLANTTYSLSARFSSAIWIGGSGILMTSDKRLKEDIKPYESKLEQYKKLNICSYKWKKTGHVDMGLIAQDTEEVMPHLVRCAGDEEMDDGLIRSIDQTRLLYETVSALQQALKRIDELESIVKKQAFEFSIRK